VSIKFEKYTCWTAESAGQAGFHTLGSRNVVDDAMVHATKVDIPITPQGGSASLSIDQLVDGFIESFEDEVSSTIYAITGDSGSGKTFVIRCAQTIVEKDSRAHVVYVPRDITSLHGILKLILRELPGELAAQALREVEASNVEELKSELLLQLVHTQIKVELAQGNGREELLSDGLLNEQELVAVNELYGKLDESSGIYRSGLSDYLAHPAVINHLIRPEGILSQHVRAMRGEVLETELGVIDENEILTPIRSVKKDLEHLENFFFFFDSHQKIAAKMIEQVRESALSAQVKTSKDLTEIVEDARHILNSQDKQLVLMFEDIANNGVGLSNSVYDLFRSSGIGGREIEISGAVSDLLRSGGSQKNFLPLRVIFAATTGHWQKIPINVRNSCRRFDVRTLSIGDEKSEQIGYQIIAKYFNAARIGKSAMTNAWATSSESDRDSGHWIPNKCEGCEVRLKCHGEFGDVDGVGLYPLNKIAARKVLQHFENINIGEGHIGFSPRDIVRRLVSEWLRESHATISTGKFPNARVEEIVGEEGSLIELGFNRSAVVSDAEFDRLDQEMLHRVYRSRVVWADYINKVPKESYSLVFADAFNLDKETSIEHPDAPLDPPGFIKTIKPILFHVEYSDVTKWASGEMLSPSRVKVIRELLVKLVRQSLRLDHNLISGRQTAIRNLIDEYLGPTSIRIEGALGDELDNRRIQKQILRSPESRVLLHAAYWFNETGGWESEYKRGAELLTCLPDVRFKGRYLLNEWIDSLASQITSKIRESVDEAVLSIQLAQFRLLSLNNPELINDTNVVAVQKLTDTDFQLEGQFAPTGNNLIDDLARTFDAVVSSAISARQGEGSTRIAEDVVTKLRVFDEFKQNPDWRGKVEISADNQLLALREELKSFSEIISNELSNGEKSINEFRLNLNNLDLESFRSDLDDFKRVFETLISRSHVNVQPQVVRTLIDELQNGISKFIQEKDSLNDLVDSSKDMSDPEIWGLLKRFPFLNDWAQNFVLVMDAAEKIERELAGVVKGKAVPDVKRLREDIENCLLGVVTAMGGVDNVI
jgi:type II secretory pathway predicted ATPase ExeA